jgi:site-specific recombinase XerD
MFTNVHRACWHRATVIRMALTIWRRHTPACPFSSKGRDYLKCDCPIWADGYVDGKRVLRKSLGTRDMARARKKASALESPDQRIYRSVAEAKAAFLAHCESEGLKFSSRRKYRNTLIKLLDFCEKHNVDSVNELTTDVLDRFRAGRGLKPVTSSKELQFLRQFCGFCVDRRWMESNPAKRIKSPRNLKPNDVEPFTSVEVGRIVAACGVIGSGAYERLRARAMVLTLRYTALRVGDVALLARDRISRDGKRWRIFLRTEKNGKPVFLPIPQQLKDALDAAPLPRGLQSESKHFFWNGITSERSMKGIVERAMLSVFRKSAVPHAHAHRFRHTLATELLGRGATFEEIADILGNSPDVVRKHYAKWSVARQMRIDELMEGVYSEATYLSEDVPGRVQ